MDLSKLKLLNMPIPNFVATQIGIGALRGTGYVGSDITQLTLESGARSFIENGRLKPFSEGVKHLAGRIGTFTKEHPAYIAAGALGSVGGVKAWNILAKPFYPKAKPKLSLGERFEKGIKKDVTKISDFVFKHPIATIAGIGGAALVASHMYQDKRKEN